MPNCERWPNAVSVAVAVLFAVVFLGPFGDLDYSWQILHGRQIVETGCLRVTDQLSYTIAGQQIPDFEWLWEVTLYGVWHFTGYVGLKVMKLLCAVVPLFIVARQLRHRGVGWAGTLLAMIIAVAMLAPNWNLRPLYCTTVGLLLVSGWLHDHCAGRRMLTWWLPAVMLIWANSHPGVIAGQGLLLGAIAWEWINVAIRLNKPLDRPALKRLTLIGGIGFLLTFVSPDPIERLLYPFRTRLDNPVWQVFVEMRPAYTFITLPPYTAILSYVVAALVALSVVMRFRQWRMWEIALLACVAGMANVAVRSLPDWLLLNLALGVPRLKELCQSAASQCAWINNCLAKWREMAHSPPMRWQPTYAVAAIILLVVIGVVPATRARLLLIDVPQNPVAAVDWMQQNNIHGRFFGSTDYGAYLVWRMGDRAKSFVDTRGFYFPMQLIADSHQLPQLDPDWQARLDRVLAAGTDYFLMETTGPHAKLWQTLQPHVEPLYQDGQTVLLTAQQVRDGRQIVANSIVENTAAAATGKDQSAADVR